MTPHATLHAKHFTVIVRWAIVLALWVLLISMATGQSGVSNYLELVRNRDELAQVTRTLALDNQFLGEQIRQLKTWPDAQLRYLKDNFGYVEKGEFVYHFNRQAVPRIPGKKLPAKLTSATRSSKPL